ncbi:hypothetical protein E4T56_gene11460 [Termitomyces sp. T112]|nr:hypothetical protein E4T56_gene11460 [Termitomyces sp. T112]
MLSMNPPFIQQSPQQPMAAVGLAQSPNGPNPAINPQQRYNLPPAAADGRQQRPMQMRPAQPGPPMMGPSGGPVPGGAGIVGMPHFNPNMNMNMGPGPGGGGGVTMGGRRVASQPQMNPGGGGGAGVVVNNMGMAPQMRQQLRMQQAQPGLPHPHMPPEMSMRPGAGGGGGGGGGGMPGRTGSTPQQLMNSLSQPPSSMQPPPLGHPHASQFQNSVVPHPPQIPSPRPGSLPGSSHTPGVGRAAQMSPDEMLMAYPGAQFVSSGHTHPHAVRALNGQQQQQQFPPFVPGPSSTPPISMPDMPQGLGTPGGSGGGGVGGVGNTRSPFHITPAQQYEQMNHTSPGSFPFEMGPPSVGPRPPSRLNPNPNPHQTSNPHPHPGSNAHQNPNPNPHTPTPVPHPQLHHSPHAHSHPHAHTHPHSHSHPHSDLTVLPGRPQSQPQRPPSQQAHALSTPRAPPMHPVRPGTLTGIPPGPQPGPGPGSGPGPGLGAQMGMQMQIAPRPGVAPGNHPHHPHPHAQNHAQNVSNGPASSAPSDTPPSNAAVIPRHPVSSTTPLVGQGQGLMRLLQFSASLATESKPTQKLQLSWWKDLINEYFTPKAMMKFTLWKDNQRNEAKPFDIGVPILPRFFLVTTQSGVKSMTLSIDGARERIYGPGHSMIECINAIWTYKYANGYTVTLRGPLTAHIVVTAILPPGTGTGAPSPPAGAHGPGQGPNQPPVPNVVLKFEEFQFDAHMHDKYVSLDSIQGTRSVISPPHIPGMPMQTQMQMQMPMNGPSPTPGVARQQQQLLQLDEDRKWEEPRVTIEMASIPGEPVNSFGIPQATMRCLELAESVSAMTDLILFSTEQGLGPLDALNRFAAKLREVQPFNPPPILPPQILNGPQNSNPFASMQNTISPTSTNTLYSSAPSSVTNPSGTLTHPTNNLPTPTGTGSGNTASPKNAPPSVHNSPQKQHKTIPQQTPGASSSSSSSNVAAAVAAAAAASPAVSSGGTTNTPALSHTSLKRKQGSETASPTNTVEAQPPAKRPTRRRKTNATNSGAGG